MIRGEELELLLIWQLDARPVEDGHEGADEEAAQGEDPQVPGHDDQVGQDALEEEAGAGGGAVAQAAQHLPDSEQKVQ